jgi:hypothetical protein
MSGKAIFRRLARYLSARSPQNGVVGGTPVTVAVKHPALRGN